MTTTAHSAPGRILVVDDEPSITDAVATALRYEGYEVEEAATGRDALAAVTRQEPDLVVLDWMLPDISGIEVGRRLRERGLKTAILFLTAKDAVEDKVEALRAGGDDYVTKPFSLAEIAARVQAVLRRTNGDLSGDVLRFADVTLDESRHEVFRGDTPIELTATEFNLLRFFMLDPRRVLSKPQILQNVWHYDFGGSRNVVETYVSYLRRKLDAAGPPLIRTVRQFGYMLEAEKWVVQRLSLRARLILGVIALAGIGLVAADVITYTSLHSFLISAVLAGVAILGLWVIRVGLRPLTEIGATAATIAAGDLSHRVVREDDRTEVGRLGRALNAMLAQIESAFNAREASERKLRRFVADASHELRTPLAAVRAYAELFSRGAAQRPADLERSMAGITRESERMSVLVEDLLLLARLDEGRPLERERVELHDVVAESVETARMLEPERVITCSLDQATVVGDRDRLRQVVDNLVSNVRACRRGCVRRRALSSADGVVARLTVTDSGPGLAPDQSEHVFERFYRADPSRARAAGGAGLGLSIVAAVTEAQGGRATASAAPHGGAAFTIELPLATRP